VFEQDGYAVQQSQTDGAAPAPMLDFMFAVTHAAHWHSINMHQHASHYPLHARLLGSSYISRVEDITPGVWFNTYIPMKGVVSHF
jgi:translocator assembly and maintenance protein 41